MAKTVKIKDLPLLKRNCFIVKGESFTAPLNYDYKKLLEELNAKIVMTEDASEGNSYYAYSKKIRYCKTINDKKINLHIFVGKTGITVGTPIIYGSF